VIAIVKDIPTGTQTPCGREQHVTFVSSMRQFVGQRINVIRHERIPTLFSGAGWNWHPSWLRFIRARQPEPVCTHPTIAKEDDAWVCEICGIKFSEEGNVAGDVRARVREVSPRERTRDGLIFVQSMRALRGQTFWFRLYRENIYRQVTGIGTEYLSPGLRIEGRRWHRDWLEFLGECLHSVARTDSGWECRICHRKFIKTETT